MTARIHPRPTARPAPPPRARLGGLVLAALFALLLAAAFSAPAQQLRPVPPLSGRVVDQTGTLSAAQQQALAGKLAALEQATGSQLVVLLVPGTLPEDITVFAQRVGEQWKVGRRDVGDGLLVVVAKDERRVRIEVAKALEGAVPDLMAKRIINEQLSPAFKAGDYAGGLNAAVDALGARIRGEGLPLPPPSGPAGDLGRDSRGAWDGNLEGWLIFLLAGVPVIGSVFTALLGRKLGAVATGAGAGGIGWLVTSSPALAGGVGVLALVLVGVLGLGATRRGGWSSPSTGPIIWTGGGLGGGWGSGGGGSSSGGGGGFSSGGGGDFGGGGASGDW